ncbi:PD-(D/E)XK nuclease family protein [Altericista sp. CCNU0014]|uniref:PD-(D/E)XK nuclease family protein n=1 Tax=Altericista sp. CCNU0014 TaxID=3082949 RepID=UPI003851264E
MEHLPFLQLSQAHLQVLETCPRKFQYLFLDSLMLPQPSLVSENQVLGRQFHQLMQQRELGLDIQPLLDDNPKLREWFQFFQDAPPPLLTGQWRQSEYQCTLELEGFTLIAVYDLLIRDTSTAQIVDWKTYPRPPRVQLLQQHWQTRLYLFIAAEALGYPPDRVSMLYWFAELPERSASRSRENWLSISYSETLHRQTRETLTKQLTNLRGWVKDFIEHRQDFPQVPLADPKCGSNAQPCSFASACQRYPDRPDRSNTALADLTDLAAIAELPLDPPMGPPMGTPSID